jgi:hypothetical protein
MARWPIWLGLGSAVAIEVGPEVARPEGDDVVITLRAPLLSGPHAVALDGLRS